MERGTERSAEPRGSPPKREGAEWREPIGKEKRHKKKFFLRNAVVLLLASPKAVNRVA